MRQRLALAIALLGNPEFLVLDEPINGLDPTGIIELRNLLKRLNKERGITILISSHILTELHQLANRYGILHEGKLLQEITATELDKRCKKHLLLQVNDVAAASVLLESKLNTSNFTVMPDKSIHLYDYVENAGKVSALLSANNISRSNGTSGQGLYIVKKLLLMMNCTNPIIEIHDHNFMITIDFSPLLIKK